MSNTLRSRVARRTGAGAGSVLALLALLACVLAGLWWLVGTEPTAPEAPPAASAEPAERPPRYSAPLAEVSAEERAGDQPVQEQGEEAPARLEDGDARFDGRGSIQGEVSTPAGASLPDVYSVVVGPAAHLVGGERAVTRRIEMLDGRREFRFDDLPLGGYDVYAEARGMNGKRRSVLLVKHSADQHVDLTLTPAGILDGRVQDERGEPVAGITMTLTSKADGTRTEEVTDDLGFYVFEGVLDGEYVLTVGAPEAPLVPPKSVTFEAPRVTVPVEGVPLTSEVLVVTIDAEGKPLPSVRVRGFGTNGGSVDTVTDHEGVARLRFLPPGRFRLAASTEDGRRARSTIEVQPGQVTRAEIRLR